MKKIKSWIKTYILPYKHLHVEKNQWDEQYEIGHWDYLKSSEQLPRFSIIAGTFYHLFGDKGTILDLGCGENVLQKMLLPFNYKLYVGVDISESAIQRASVSEDEKTHFICQDIKTYEPEHDFDMIVFNESLYYIENPDKLLKKYVKHLKENGIILISMWNYKERNNKIWKMIKGDFSTVDEIFITVNNNKSWIIKTVRPH